MPRGMSRGTVDVLESVSRSPAARHVTDWTRRLLAAAGAGDASVSVLLCGDGRIRTLNREFRGKDRATDVLSFPSGEPGASRGIGFLGDVVLAVPSAARQARGHGHALAREVQILLAHGLLHLLGHDHETDDGTMFRLQRELVGSVFGPGPDGVPPEEPA